MIEELKLLIVKEKLIYYNLNLLEMENDIYRGYAWIPIENED